jgi:hypothetical protein
MRPLARNVRALLPDFGTAERAPLKNACLASDFERARRSARRIPPDSPALERTLTAVYLVALVGVAVSILWVLADAVMSVSRKPHWETQVFRSVTLVPTEDRRKQNLPFVGVDRRKARAAQASAADRKVA